MDGGDIGDSSGALGTGWHCPWPRGRAGGGLRTSGSLVPFTTFEFAAGLWRLFFCTECSWGWLDSTGRPPWKPGGSCPQSTPPAHLQSQHAAIACQLARHFLEGLSTGLATNAIFILFTFEQPTKWLNWTFLDVFPGLVTNSILFCLLFTIRNRCWNVRFKHAHNQGLRHLFLTVSSDLRAKHSTPDCVLVSL